MRVELSVLSEVLLDLSELGSKKVFDWYLNYCNFFVFKYFIIKNSVRLELVLIRTNPGSFVSRRASTGVPNQRVTEILDHKSFRRKCVLPLVPP